MYQFCNIFPTSSGFSPGTRYYDLQPSLSDSYITPPKSSRNTRGDFSKWNFEYPLRLRISIFKCSTSLIPMRSLHSPTRRRTNPGRRPSRNRAPSTGLCLFWTRTSCSVSVAGSGLQESSVKACVILLSSRESTRSRRFWFADNISNIVTAIRDRFFLSRPARSQ